MKCRVLLALLTLSALLQLGCASDSASSDNPPELTPVPSNEDDSHGWGANVKGA